MLPAAGHSPHTTAFRMACWLLGLMAFAQMWVAGIAMAKRMQHLRLSPQATASVPAQQAASPTPLDRTRFEPQTAPLLPPPPSTLRERLAALGAESAPPVPGESISPALPRGLTPPPIADPEIERLVNEAREARVAGDMGKAIIKLQEAAARDASEPNTQYELGRVHEDMGVYDTASKHYQDVFKMGTTKAGALYAEAARKLRDGFEQPNEMRSKLTLGRVRIFKDDAAPGGQRVALTIPVQKAPSATVEAKDFELRVRFFDMARGKDPLPAADNAKIETIWASGPIDWIGGEESLRVTYQIPKVGGTDAHLFGERKFYGQVVELFYQGELIDLQAWPRDLAARSQQAPVAERPAAADVPEFLSNDEPLLLPSKPKR